MTTLPDFKKGIDYWTAVDATVDGVLGGFGNGVSTSNYRHALLEYFCLNAANDRSLYPGSNNYLPACSSSPSYHSFNLSPPHSLHQLINVRRQRTNVTSAWTSAPA
jgi:hypothetical protein